MIRKLSPQDYTVSRWSGGTTTQLAIWPPEAKYADRDFLWRISSATVDLEESDFTPLPDYDRLIAALEGDIVLTHNGGEPISLRPLEVHAFSGADATHSRGRCRDFNLMLRRGRVTGSMEALSLTENEHIVPPAEQFLVYCVKGEAHVGAANGRPHEAPASQICHSERSAAESKNPSSPSPSFSLAPGEALLMTDPAPLALTGPALLMLCRMTPAN